MTFVRPYPDLSSVRDMFSSIPTQAHPVSRKLSPRVYYDAAMENPEILHSGVGLLLSSVTPPQARLLSRAVYEVAHDGGHYLWDRYAHYFPELVSSESSSRSYQQNGGSGGTRPLRSFKNIDAIPPGSRVTKPTWKTTKTDYIGNPSKGYHYCKKGWLLVKVGDTKMCWKPPGKK